ncbi:unnamed protein product, partial [Closterium sp. NIES-64]
MNRCERTKQTPRLSSPLPLPLSHPSSLSLPTFGRTQLFTCLFLLSYPPPFSSSCRFFSSLSACRFPCARLRPCDQQRLFNCRNLPHEIGGAATAPPPAAVDPRFLPAAAAALLPGTAGVG